MAGNVGSASAVRWRGFRASCLPALCLLPGMLARRCLFSRHLGGLSWVCSSSVKRRCRLPQPRVPGLGRRTSRTPRPCGACRGLHRLGPEPSQSPEHPRLTLITSPCVAHMGMDSGHEQLGQMLANSFGDCDREPLANKPIKCLQMSAVARCPEHFRIFSWRLLTPLAGGAMAAASMRFWAAGPEQHAPVAGV